MWTSLSSLAGVSPPASSASPHPVFPRLLFTDSQPLRLYSFLEELRPHEEIPEAELPEDFKWLDHEHAQAICWGLQEHLVADTEEEPLDPDAVITVALMRDVLVNYAELYLSLDDFVVTLEGEDDEMVMDLGVRLAAFYAELETFLSAGSA